MPNILYIKEVKEKLEPAKIYIYNNFNLNNMYCVTVSNLMLETYKNSSIGNILNK